jgi:hypothetical protein
MIQGVHVELTADTGAVRTILSGKIYRRIPRNRRPPLSKATGLSSASGDPLEVLGKADFEVQMGDFMFQQEIIVAEIDDESLLGLDVLLDHQDGPAIIDLSRNFILINDSRIPINKVSEKSQTRRVVLMDNYKIPPLSEIIARGMIQRNEKDFERPQEVYAIEPDPTFEIKNAVVVAAALVDSTKKVSIPMRIMNPSNNEANLKQDDVVGHAEICGEEDLKNLSLTGDSRGSQFSLHQENRSRR